VHYIQPAGATAGATTVWVYIVVVKYGSENLELAVAFFQQVKQRPGVKRGQTRWG